MITVPAGDGGEIRSLFLDVPTVPAQPILSFFAAERDRKVV